ncbi:MAG: flagellar basal-body rod protein FlgF [Alkalispirochaetaceae bacterium]
MVRGIYTAASGMLAQEHRLDAISNNIANVETTGYKRDTSVHKAFPELLIRRMSDDGVRQFPLRSEPLGSYDIAPVVGKLGTGVEQNEVFTVYEQGEFQQTGNALDFALEGEGFFVVQTPRGERMTRNGEFMIGPEGLLVTKQGYPVLGENGPIPIQMNNFQLDDDGTIYANPLYLDDPDRLVSMAENEWGDRVPVDRLQLVNVREPRYLQKQGDSLYETTFDSGEREILEGDARPGIMQRFLEGSNVNPVREMVEMIEVNRAYEANQKVVQTQDTSTGQLLNLVSRG